MKLVLVVLLVVAWMQIVAADNCKAISAPAKLKWVSTGQAGVWGIARDDRIFYRKDTYNRVNGGRAEEGTSWSQVAGNLKQISVGWNIVWGVNRHNHIYYRTGISQNNPQGKRWVQVPGLLKKISVCPLTNSVWGVNRHKHIYFRTGITGTSPQGCTWQRIHGILHDVSVDGAGVWGVHRTLIYYRNGTFLNQNSPGNDWIRMNGRLTNINSGNKGVWGVNRHGKEYFADNIIDSPSFHQHTMPWKLISRGKLQVSANGNYGYTSVWSLDTAGNVCVRV